MLQIHYLIKLILLKQIFDKLKCWFEQKLLNGFFFFFFLNFMFYRVSHHQLGECNLSQVECFSIVCRISVIEVSFNQYQCNHNGQSDDRKKPFRANDDSK